MQNGANRPSSSDVSRKTTMTVLVQTLRVAQCSLRFWMYLPIAGSREGSTFNHRSTPLKKRDDRLLRAAHEADSERSAEQQQA